MAAKELAERTLFSGEDSAHRAIDEVLNASGDGAVLARFAYPRAATPTTIAVASDLHVADGSEGSWKMFHRTQSRVEHLFAAVAERDVDGLVVSGDVTKDGEAENFEWFADALADVNVPVLAVPGNHDVLDHPVSHFEDLFTDGGFPVRERLGGVDVIGLDTSAGELTDEQFDWLAETLPEVDDPIVVSHHNLPGLREHIGDGEWTPHPPMSDAETVVELFADHDVPLHLSGHVHLPAVVENAGVRGVIAPALSSFPQGYLLLDVDRRGTTVRCLSAADESGIEEAYGNACEYSTRSNLIADITAEQLAALPVVDEREGDLASIRCIL